MSKRTEPPTPGGEGNNTQLPEVVVANAWRDEGNNVRFYCPVCDREVRAGVAWVNAFDPWMPDRPRWATCVACADKDPSKRVWALLSTPTDELREKLAKIEQKSGVPTESRTAHINGDPLEFEGQEIFFDGRWKSPAENWYYAPDLDSIIVISQNEDFSYPVDSLEEAFAYLIEHVGKKHPDRIARYMQKFADAGEEIEIGMIDKSYESHALQKDEEFYITVDKQIVFKHDLELYKYRDCHQGTDDHDDLYRVIAGPYAGKVLENYASRWQGSADYACTLYNDEGEIDNIEEFINS